MKYTLTALYIYYAKGKHTRDTAYLSANALVAVVIWMLILRVSEWGLGYKFTIPFYGKNGFLNYALMAIIFFPIQAIIYIVYPPHKIRDNAKEFRNNKMTNILLIFVFIVLFFMLFI